MEKENRQEAEAMPSVPKITKIETQKRKGRYNIHLDGEYAFPVDEAILIKHVLHKGMEVPKDLQEQLESEDDYRKAYTRALNYLSSVLRSQKEVYDDLLAHEVSPETANQVIEQLKEQKYINDLVYAESYTRTAANLSGKGPYAIRQELRKRGVDANTIEQALEQYPFDQMVENGNLLAEKVIRRSKGKSSRETANKVRQNLMQKGFNSDIINQVLEQTETDKEEEQETDALKIQGDKLWRKHARLDGYKKKQKVKTSLYQKGFDGDLISQYISEKEMEEEE